MRLNWSTSTCSNRFLELWRIPVSWSRSCHPRCAERQICPAPQYSRGCLGSWDWMSNPWSYSRLRLAKPLGSYQQMDRLCDDIRSTLWLRASSKGRTGWNSCGGHVVFKQQFLSMTPRLCVTSANQIVTMAIWQLTESLPGVLHCKISFVIGLMKRPLGSRKPADRESVDSKPFCRAMM